METKKYQRVGKAGIAGMISLGLIFLGTASPAKAQVMESHVAETTRNAAIDFGIIEPLQKAAQTEQTLDAAFSQIESLDGNSEMAGENETENSDGENSDLSVVNQRLGALAQSAQEAAQLFFAAPGMETDEVSTFMDTISQVFEINIDQLTEGLDLSPEARGMLEDRINDIQDRLDTIADHLGLSDGPPTSEADPSITEVENSAEVQDSTAETGIPAMSLSDFTSIMNVVVWGSSEDLNSLLGQLDQALENYENPSATETETPSNQTETVEGESPEGGEWSAEEGFSLEDSSLGDGFGGDIFGENFGGDLGDFLNDVPSLDSFGNIDDSPSTEVNNESIDYGLSGIEIVVTEIPANEIPGSDSNPETPTEDDPENTEPGP